MLGTTNVNDEAVCEQTAKRVLCLDLPFDAEVSGLHLVWLNRIIIQKLSIVWPFQVAQQSRVRCCDCFLVICRYVVCDWWRWASGDINDKRTADQNESTNQYGKYCAGDFCS